MRVVHIVKNFRGGGFVAAKRLHDALLSAGVDSWLLVCEMDNGEVDERTVFLKKRKFFLRMTAWLEDKYVYLNRRDKNCPFHLSVTGNNIHDNALVESADIIHVHWICGAITIKEIRALCEIGKIIVWTCHDLWPFTGGCNIEYRGCHKYKTGCRNCPLMRWDKGMAARAVKHKWNNLINRSIVFVAPSNWIKNIIKTSPILTGNKVIKISNPCDDIKFSYKGDLSKAIEKTSKEKTKDIYVLFIATSTKLEYKGFEHLLTVLSRLSKEESTLAKRIVLNIVGKHDSDVDILTKYRHHCCGYIHDEKELAEIYRKADFFINPTLADNFPNVVVESLLCGTPVLAYKTGGVVEMIDHKKNGYLAEYNDVNSLYEGLLWMIENYSNPNLGIYGHKKIKALCSPKIVADSHKELYKKVIYEKNTRVLEKKKQR